MNQDLQHLKLLSIFYYVVGGLMILFALFPIFHFGFGLMMIISPNSLGGGGPPPPPLVGWLFVLIAGAIMLVGWTLAIGTMLAGRFLSQRKHYTYCLVMAGLSLLFQPFGTILGVFTILLLIRPSVKRLFETGEIPHDPEEADEPPIGYGDHIVPDSYNIRH